MRNVAILIDGGFFLRRITSLGHHPNPTDPSEAIDCLRKVVSNHLLSLNRRYGMSIPPESQKQKRRYLSSIEHHLYRIFFYDAPPYENRATKPISKENINFKTTDTAVYRRDLFLMLRKQRALALRMGKLATKGNWVLDQKAQKELLSGAKQVDQLTDEDFHFEIKQKGVDMRIGLDIASLTLKKQIEVIVLITGDEDFVSAAKLARREGVEVILDPLRNNISADLFEHIDGLRHGLNRAGQMASDDEDDEET